MNIVARHLRISGKVQGVFYRGWSVKTALALGLVGWVRNLSDGDVEAFVQGPENDIALFVEMVRTGPSDARVAAVAIDAAEPAEISCFEQLPTV